MLLAKGSVLVIDDDASMCAFIEEALRKAGYEAQSCTSGTAGLERLEELAPDVVVTDLRMFGMSGTELCREVAVDHPDLPVVVITAFGSLDAAVDAIRAGAYDFLTKPFELAQLEVILDRAIRHHRLTREVVRLRRRVDKLDRFGGLVGSSGPMRRVFNLLDRIAPLETTLLISGETGTGKEVAARAIHQRSPRRAGPFVAVNCAAMPEALLESELFGHAKGAFTDARHAHRGLFAQADGGTLFLDEIGEMPVALQPKLLRAIEERVVRPVGGQAEIPFDARFIAASNRDLATATEEGTFREDLFYRINVLEIWLPPLRTRGADILALAEHFLDEQAEITGGPRRSLSKAAAERLLSYPWPGNVRELKNCVERGVALCESEKIAVTDLPPQIRRFRRSHVVIASDSPAELLPMELVERQYVERVLSAVGGNKAEAARILGFDRRTLYRKLERYRLGDEETST